ncbi:esterase-like activity of phytase family protein [Paracoccus tegillarcae]|uniref:Alkaline phosphatase n=1 Tax=Paracoccus tegillarcae TaxID=1529068 RepID=A0A2K9EFV5_9RHOB|nr:esterase-like activity of phytase family protein [Paracoccus tegillarcae]AUH33823.1 alkaline phosphatase [Paracoccus tegillarcae]
MRLPLPSACTLSIVASCVCAQAWADPVFNRLASFPTDQNLGEGADGDQPASPDSMARTDDGATLVYSDSRRDLVGLIDIANPAAPRPAGQIATEGAPVAVTVIGSTGYVAADLTQDDEPAAGVLHSVDLAGQTVIDSCDLAGQPASLASRADGGQLAVALAGYGGDTGGAVVAIPLTGDRLDCGGLTRIELADLNADFGVPSHIAYGPEGELAVSLQAENHVVILGADGAVETHFSAGTVDLAGVDIVEDDVIDPTGSLDAVQREPDAIAWLDASHLVTANGGSRGFTIWGRDGRIVYDSGNLLEQELIKIGHYPERRSENSGGQPETVLTASFDGVPTIFIAAERGNAVFVFDASDPSAPKLLQTLPSGIEPEALVAIPERGLLASVNSGDMVEDGGARTHVMLYARQEGTPIYPTITSAGSDPLIPWGTLSALTPDPADPTVLYSVSDGFYGAAPAIFTIDAAQSPARITARHIVTRDGKAAEMLDLEGIVSDGQGGFWLVSEGARGDDMPHAILQVDGDGAIIREISLPAELEDNDKRFGLEGIELLDGRLWLAIQREWDDDPDGLVKLVQLDPETESWAVVHYPIEASEGWVGLSDLAVHDGALYVLERDNLLGDAATVKQITRVDLEGVEPAAPGAELPVVGKTVVRDLIPDLRAQGGYILDKVEGLAIVPEGQVWMVTDNDGVNNSSGETIFWSSNLADDAPRTAAP